jgi:hypothetical protein
MFHLIGHLSPVVHQKKWDFIRVPLRKINDRYVVYVADGLVRYYDEETLPDALKTKMAMILAASNHSLESEVRLQKMTVYSNPMSSDFDDIGWRISETYFCLILDRETLESLKGGTQNGTDTREQGQGQDQEDS